MKAVCSCLRSYKRVVEFFHCGANGRALSGGGGFTSPSMCVCVFVFMCTHITLCVVFPEVPTWAFTANTGLIAQTAVHMRAVCKDAVCVIF